MGSLTSKPKTPAQTTPQIVYVPAPSPAPVPQQPAPQPSAPDPEAAAAQERVAAILKSRRGIAGTVATGLRGFLEPASAWPRRKTLLGE